MEELTSQRKDLWEFHVSHDVPSNLHSSQDFSMSPPLLRSNILGETLTPLFKSPLATQLAAFPPPPFHTQHPLLAVVIASADSASPESGPWDPCGNVRSAADGSIRQHSRQGGAVVYQKALSASRGRGPRVQPSRQSR